MIKKYTIAIICILLAFTGCDINGGSNNIPVTSVGFQQSGVSMLAGETFQMEAIIEPQDATNKSISYSSDKASVATVNETGLISAVKAGTAVVSVTTEDGGFTAAFNVTVTILETEVGSVSLDKSAITLIAGGSETVTARILPTSAINKNILWSESDASDAITLTADGSSVTVTADAVGTATVTATTEEGGFTAACTVSVVPTHTISLDANGGTGTMAQIVSGEGFTETLPASTFIPPANCVFGGWVTDPNADTAAYANGGEITLESQDVTLYAFWDSFYSFTATNGEVTITGFSDNWDRNTDIEIPSSIHGKPVVSIAAKSFMRATGLTSVVIPDSVTALPAEVFWDCDDLATVSIGAGVETMSFNTFYSCNGIATITIAAGNANYDAIDNVIFDEAHTTLIKAAPAMTGSYTVPDGVATIQREAFQGSRLTSVTLPASGLTSIGIYAFEYSNILNINIPEGVTQLWTYVFFGSSLQTISLPASFTSLRHDAFRWTWDMQSFTVDAANTQFSSNDGVLYNKAGDTMIWYPLAKDLSTFTFPSGITTIGSYAFEYNRQQVAVTIPEGVTTISSYGFYDADFASVSLPSTLTSIGTYAFRNCGNLVSLTVNATTPPTYPTNSDPLGYTNANLVISVPANSVDAYKNAAGWSAYADKIIAISN